MGDLQIVPAADWRPPLLVVLAGRIGTVGLKESAWGEEDHIRNGASKGEKDEWAWRWSRQKGFLCVVPQVSGTICFASFS
jgi:hypothetical protein